MKNFITLLTGVLLLFISACSDDDDNNGTACDQRALLDAELLQNAPSQQLTINSVTLTGDCLLINFSSSGCNGETWEFDLIGGRSDATVFPPLINVRLTLESSELCEALISREVSFELSPFQQNGTDRVSLFLQNNNQSLLYIYN